MSCRVCDKNTLSLVIDLGSQPLAHIFLKKEEVGGEPFYPLRVVHCEHCKTAQLDVTVKKEIVYENHTYLSGTTKTLNLHFQQIAKSIDDRFFHLQEKKSVLDIGSNEGTLLAHFQALGYEVLGVEAAGNIAKRALSQGIPTLHAFFNKSCAQLLNHTYDLIHAAGVFFHLEELHSATEGIRLLLKPKGVFVIQFLYVKSIQENGAFDQIYHEHLLYYSLHSVEEVLMRHGLTVFDAEYSSIHGGSIIAYAGHVGHQEKTLRLKKLKEDELRSQCNEASSYIQLANRIESLQKRSLDFLSSKKQAGKRVYGMGAPVKGNTLLNRFKIGPSYIECLVEKNPLRKHLFSPGMHVPIELEAEMPPPDAYYVLAWNFKDEILKNNRPLIEKGVDFFFPIDLEQV